MKQYIIDAIHRIPMLQEVSPDEIDIERMGGLNNETYHLTVHDQDYSLRIPGDAEANMINRTVRNITMRSPFPLEFLQSCYSFRIVD